VNPAIYANTIVWTDWRNDPGDQSNSDIYAWNPVHGERAICAAPWHQDYPAICGDTIVWEDHRNAATTGYDVYAWDPVHGERAVCTAPGDQGEPAIYGNTIVWTDRRDLATTGCDIYAYFGWETVFLGDINGDWRVDAADLEAFLLAWRQAHQPQPAVDARCDMDKDGRIDQEDAQAFLAFWLPNHTP
jgi:beta propeller repeat protein